MKRKKLQWFLILAGFFSSFSAVALTVLQLNIAQLTDLAARVFVGTCVSVRQATDSSGRKIQYVTYKVQETIKGDPANTITFKQIVLQNGPSQPSIMEHSLVGDMPQYEPGEEAVVFLSGESRLGFTAPVGIFQGKFDVQTDTAGNKTVVNALDNRGLFIGMRSSPTLKAMSLSSSEKQMVNTNSGEMDYSDFVNLVKKINASQQN